MKKLRVLAGAAFAPFALIVLAEQVPACLGPLGVTLAQCAKGLAESGRPFAPGPGPGSAMMAIVPLALLFATLIPWRRLDRPALIATALAGLAAGVLGILYYDVTRPTSITQTNAISGITHTAPLAANADLRILTGLLAASVVGVTLAWLIVVVRDWRHHQAS